MSESTPLVMWPIKKIAERDKVSVPAVSKRVKKLIKEHDLPVERDKRDRVSAVSVAHYDHHCGFFGNSEKNKKPEQDGDAGDELSPRVKESRDEALRQDAWLSLSRKKIAHEETVGALVRADKYTDALQTVGRTIQREISRLQNRADDVALAVSKEGEHGARLALRKIATEMGNSIADALEEIAAEAPKHDAVLEDEVS